MNTQFRNMLVLLGKAINQKSNKTLTEPVEWGAVLSYARFHKVLPVILETASEIGDCVKFPSYGEYLSQATLATVEQAQKTALFIQLYKKFINKGIYPVVMKGLICRLAYGDLCDHRASGDEDLLIDPADYEIANQILKDNGYSPDFDNITPAQAETVREVIYTNPDTSLRIELHFNAIGYDNDWLAPMNELFLYRDENFREITVNGTKIRTFSHTKQFLFLICHALKHFTFCGLGIRQITDILLYAKVYGNELDGELIEKKLKEFDAVNVCSDFFHLGNTYLGFDFELKTEPLCVDMLTDDLAESGIYGNETNARKASAHVLGAAMSQRNSSGGKLRILLNTVISDRKRLVNMCPELEDKPYLIFREQIRRLGRFMKLKKESDSNLAKEGFELGSKRIDLLKKYKLL